MSVTAAMSVRVCDYSRGGPRVPFVVGPQVLAAKTFRWTLEQPVHPFYFNFLHQPHHFHQ